MRPNYCYMIIMQCIVYIQCILHTVLFACIMHIVYTVSIYKNRKRLSVPCYFLVPFDKRKHTAHAH